MANANHEQLLHISCQEHHAYLRIQPSPCPGLMLSGCCYFWRSLPGRLGIPGWKFWVAAFSVMVKLGDQEARRGFRDECRILSNLALRE